MVTFYFFNQVLVLQSVARKYVQVRATRAARAARAKFQLKELISSLNPSGDFFSFHSICSFCLIVFTAMLKAA